MKTLTKQQFEDFCFYADQEVCETVSDNLDLPASQEAFLEAYVDASSFEHYSEILALIDLTDHNEE